MLSFVQGRCERGYLVDKLFESKSLVHYAVYRPNLSRFQVPKPSIEVTRSVINFLFEQGAQPCGGDELQELLGEHRHPEYLNGKEHEPKREMQLSQTERERTIARWSKRQSKRRVIERIKVAERQRRASARRADRRRKAQETRNAERGNAQEH